VKKSYITS